MIYLTIKGESGGIAGSSDGISVAATISNCTNYGQIKYIGSCDVGGIAGYCTFTTLTNNSDNSNSSGGTGSTKPGKGGFTNEPVGAE